MNKKKVFLSGFLLISLVFAGLMATVFFIPIARANTITVNTTDDEVNNDGDCSLREAVISANTDTAVDACVAGAGEDIITLPFGTYILTLGGAGEDAAQTGDLDLTADLIINGAGRIDTIIDGNGTDRIFDVHSDTAAQISNVTLQNGNATSGGGVNVSFSGELTLTGSRVTANIASSSGGGIFANDRATVVAFLLWRAIPISYTT